MKDLKQISTLLLFFFSLFLVSCEKVDPKMEILADPETETAQWKAAEINPTDEINYLLSLIEEIEALYGAGDLNKGNANALIVKIENAIKSLDKGNNNAAENQLGAFINNVEGFVENGVISEEIGEILITKTENRDLLSKGSFIDPRDEQEYKVVLIGNQIWMAENLAYDAGEGCTAYNNDEDNVPIYGRLYEWNTAMTVAPPGWHLATDDEWKQMELAIGMNSEELDVWGDRGTNEGDKLKTTYGWDYNGNGTNEYGFSALPAGVGPNYWNGLGIQTHWWMATEGLGHYSYTAWHRNIASWDTGIARYRSSKPFHKSIRCVKD